MTAGKKLRHDEAAPLLMEHELWPLERYTNSKTRWHCRCTRCGDDAWPRYSTLKGLGKRGCATCSRSADGFGLTDIQAFPIMLAAGLWPLEPYTSSKTPWLCECMACGSEVAPSHCQINSGYGGCSSCGYIARGRARYVCAGVQSWQPV